MAGTQEVVTTDYSFDLDGRLSNLTHSQNTNPLAGYEWVFDDADRITKFTSLLDGTSDYNYDDRDQLIDATHSYQSDEDYSYDQNGNRTNAGYVTDDNNYLLSDGTYDYEYDSRKSHQANRNRHRGCDRI